MIKRIHVDNYKCLINFELMLDDSSLLIEANGVGESSVLDPPLEMSCCTAPTSQHGIDTSRESMPIWSTTTSTLS